MMRTFRETNSSDKSTVLPIYSVSDPNVCDRGNCHQSIPMCPSINVFPVLGVSSYREPTSTAKRLSNMINLFLMTRAIVSNVYSTYRPPTCACLRVVAFPIPCSCLETTITKKMKRVKRVIPPFLPASTIKKSPRIDHWVMFISV